MSRTRIREKPSARLLRQPACDGWRVAAFCVLLAVAVLLVFGQTVWQGFFNLDDQVFVHDEPHVSGGLSWSGFAWAFTKGPEGDWCPLAMLSHMLDCQLFGIRPAGHHLTNVALHAASAVLLFLVLLRMTERLWPAAMVAALFALHPLRVESVAWIAERRDVLSGLFFMFTLAAYVEYVRHGRSLARYLVVCAMLALGLLAKAMLITVPALLLLVDFWPLGRLGQADPGGAASLASAVLLASGARETAAVCLGPRRCLRGARQSSEPRPQAPLVAHRSARQCRRFLRRVYRSAADADRAIDFLFLSRGWLARLAGGGRRLARGRDLGGRGDLSAVVSLFVRRLVLVPGHAGSGARADSRRRTRGPTVTPIFRRSGSTWRWSLARCSWGPPGRPVRWVFGVGSAVLLAALMVCTWRQTSLWRDSKTVWQHALACDEKNVTAHYNLGLVCESEDERGAVAQFQLALRRNPADRGFYDPPRAGSHIELGNLAENKGDVAAAIAHYRQALELQPGSGSAHAKLALALGQTGNDDEAMPHFQRSIELEPERVVMYNNRAMALVRQGKLDEALADFRQAEKLDPDSLPVQVNLASCLADAGKFEEAILHFRRAIEIDPDAIVLYQLVAQLLRRQEQNQPAAEWDARAVAAGRRLARTENRRGSELAKQGKIDAVLACFQAAIAADAGFAPAHDNLADVLAARGRIQEAIEHYRRALQIDPADARAKSGLARWPDLETGAVSGR